MKHSCSKAFLLSASLAFVLAGCSSNSSDLTDHSGQTLTGLVTAVDGNLAALSLGEYDQEAAGNFGGGMPDMAGGQMEMPADADGQQSADMSGIPDKPEDDAGSEAAMDQQAVPDKPEGEDTFTLNEGDSFGGGMPDMGGGQMPDMGGGQMPGGDMTSGRVAGFTSSDETVIISIKGASNAADVAAGDIISVTMGSDNTASSIDILYEAKDMAGGGFGSDATSNGTASTTISEDGEYSDTSYSSDGDDENALLIDGATVTLTDITVDKAGGSSSSAESGDFYGVNAAVLAKNGAQVTISDSEVTSDAQNGNGIFSYGSGTTVTVLDTKITTSADNSGGIMTTGGAVMNASGLTVSTAGNSAAAIRSDRGGGTVVVDKGSYTTSGYNSPAVYSTADITVKNADLKAENSEALVIEGENSITLEDCTVSGNMSDDKGSSSDENVHCVMVYQSMSGDANEGTSSLSIAGGTLVCKNGDVFHFTNTAATLYLSGVDITDNEEDGYLFSITGNDASKGWGTAGKNGAQVTATMDGQDLEGDIVVDTISTLDLTLKNSSTLKGMINITDNAQSGTAVDDNVTVTIEKGSVWTLTGNCTITALNNEGTINYNGHTITLADGTVLSD